MRLFLTQFKNRLNYLQLSPCPNRNGKSLKVMTSTQVSYFSVYNQLVRLCKI